MGAFVSRIVSDDDKIQDMAIELDVCAALEAKVSGNVELRVI